MKTFLRYMRTFLPRRIPVGLSALNAIVAEVVWLSGLPDNQSIRQDVAGMVFQLPPTVLVIWIRPLARQLRFKASKQVALSVLKNSNGMNEQSTTQTAP